MTSTIYMTLSDIHILKNSFSTSIVLEFMKQQTPQMQLPGLILPDLGGM